VGRGPSQEVGPSESGELTIGWRFRSLLDRIQDWLTTSYPAPQASPTSKISEMSQATVVIQPKPTRAPPAPRRKSAAQQAPPVTVKVVERSAAPVKQAESLPRSARATVRALVGGNGVTAEQLRVARSAYSERRAKRPVYSDLEQRKASQRFVANLTLGDESGLAPEALQTLDQNKKLAAASFSESVQSDGFVQAAPPYGYSVYPKDPNSAYRCTFPDPVRATVTSKWQTDAYRYDYFLAQLPSASATTSGTPTSELLPATAAIVQGSTEPTWIPARYSEPNGEEQPHGPRRGIGRIDENGEEFFEWLDCPGQIDEFHVTFDPTARGGWANNAGITHYDFKVEVHSYNGRKPLSVGSVSSGTVTIGTVVALDIFAALEALDAGTMPAGYYGLTYSITPRGSLTGVALGYAVYGTLSLNLNVDGGRIPAGGYICNAHQMMPGFNDRLNTTNAIAVCATIAKQSPTGAMLNQGGTMYGVQVPRTIAWWDVCSLDAQGLTSKFADIYDERKGTEGSRGWLLPAGKSFALRSPSAWDGGLRRLDYIVAPNEDFLYQYVTLPLPLGAASSTYVPAGNLLYKTTYVVYFDSSDIWTIKRWPAARESLVTEYLEMLRTLDQWTDNPDHLTTLASQIMGWFGGAARKVAHTGVDVISEGANAAISKLRSFLG